MLLQDRESVLVENLVHTPAFIAANQELGAERLAYDEVPTEIMDDIVERFLRQLAGEALETATDEELRIIEREHLRDN